ncbi:MAG: hypothetical protein ACREUF_03525 [Solimonas sp.]
MTRDEAIDVICSHPNLLRFLRVTRDELAAMPDVYFRDYAGSAGRFLAEMGSLQGQLGEKLHQYAELRSKLCSANNLAHRAQRLRDLKEEMTRIQRRLRDEYLDEDEVPGMMRGAPRSS